MKEIEHHSTDWYAILDAVPHIFGMIVAVVFSFAAAVAFSIVAVKVATWILGSS